MPARRPSLLTLAPWRRAPALLLHAPGVLAAIAGAAFLLTLAVASRPLFLGSAGAAAVDSDLQDGCRYSVGLRVTTGRIARANQADQADASAIPHRTRLLEAAAGNKGHQPMITTIAAGNPEIANAADPAKPGHVVQLFSRTGSFEHVNLRAGTRTDTDGLWLPDTAAAAIGVTAGDTVSVVLAGQRITDRVAAVFDDLIYVDRPKFWCSMERSFEPLGNNPLPPVALATQEHVLALLDQADRRPPSVTWEVPPRDGLSLPEADALSARLDGIDHDLRRTSDLSTAFGEGDGVQVHVGLPDTMVHAHNVTGQVRTTADTVGTAGTAIALVAVAAAGFFWVDRRRNEVNLLMAKGVGPPALALKAALEAAAPVVVGAALGTTAAIVAVRAFGPSSAFDAEAAAEAARLSAAAALAGLVLLGAAAGIRVRRAEQRMAGAPHGNRVIAPLLLAALTIGALAAGISIEQAAGDTQLDGGQLGLVVVVFPLLVLVGGGGLLAVVGYFLLPRTRRLGRRWPMAPYLALRRVASAGPLALALTAGSVVSAGILLYASVVAESARATVVAKAGIGVGADMAAFLTTDSVPPLPPDLDRRSTVIMRSAVTTEDGEQVGVLGIDPATFARGALYDRSFGNRSLDSLLVELDEADPQDDAIPVIAADAAALPDRFTVETTTGPTEVVLVARAHAFPGITGEQPLLIATEADLRASGVIGNHQLWVRGATAHAKAQLDRARVPYITTIYAKTNESAFALLPLATSLGYFKALGVLGGTVTLCGAVFYLASRERARRLAGVMARGMGLTRRAARGALAIELAALLLTGLALGGLLSSWAARATFPHLDPSPGTPPALIFRWDRTTPLVALLVTLLAAGTLALLSERASSRRLAAEVIRDA